MPKHEDLRKELLSLLPSDYEFLPEKKLRRCIVAAFREHPELEAKVRARREEAKRKPRIDSNFPMNR